MRLMQAVERLCASQSPASLTMRGVAEEAGVSVGLAYHHFESKDDLIGCTLDRLGSRIAAEATAAGNPGEGLTRLWDAMAQVPAFARIVTALIEEGRDVTALMSGHPLIRDTTARAAAEGNPDPETVGALVALLGMAGAFYGPMVNRAVGREAGDRRLYGAVAEMLESWILDPDASDGTAADARGVDR